MLASAEVKETRTSRRRYAAASAAWTGLILFSSTTLASELCEGAFARLYGATLGKHSASQNAFELTHFLAEKGLHLTLFCVFGILMWQVFTLPRWPRIGAVLVAGLIVGTSSELLQTLFPGRDPAIRDVLVNGFGALLGAAISISKSRD